MKNKIWIVEVSVLVGIRFMLQIQYSKSTFHHIFCITFFVSIRDGPDVLAFSLRSVDRRMYRETKIDLLIAKKLILNSGDIGLSKLLGRIFCFTWLLIFIRFAFVKMVSSIGLSLFLKWSQFRLTDTNRSTQAITTTIIAIFFHLN